MPTLAVAINARGAQSGASEFASAVDRMKSSASGIDKSIKSVSSGVDVLGRTLSSVGRIVTGFFGYFALSGSIGGAIRQLTSFDATMKHIQANAGLTGSAIKDVERHIRSMAIVSDFSATEAADAFLLMTKSGIDAGTAMKMQARLIDTVKVSAVDFATVLGTVDSAMVKFGMGVEDVNDVTNALVRASRDFNAPMEGLQAGLRSAGTAAKESGMPFEDLLVLLAKLPAAGAEGSAGGMQLKSMMKMLRDPSKEAQQAIADLGLSMGDLRPGDLIGSLTRLGDAGMTVNQSFQIFGQRSYALASSMSKMGVDFENARARIGETGDSIAEMGVIIEQSAVEAIQGFGRAIGELSINQFGALSGAISSSITYLTRIVRQFTIFADSEDTSAKSTADVVKSILAASAAFAGLTIAIKSANLVTAIFNAIMAANPFGLVLVAISALVGVLYYYRDTMISIGDTTASVCNWIKVLWGELVERFSVIVSSYYKLWVAYNTAVYEFTKQTVSELWDGFKQFFVATGDGLSELFGVIWSMMLQSALNAAKAFVNAVIGMFVALGATIRAFIQVHIDAFDALASFDFSSPLSSVSRVSAKLKEIAGMRFDDVKAGFKDAFTTDFVGEAMNAGVSIGVAIKEGMKAVLGEVKFGELMSALDFSTFGEDVKTRLAAMPATSQPSVELGGFRPSVRGVVGDVADANEPPQQALDVTTKKFMKTPREMAEGMAEDTTSGLADAITSGLKGEFSVEKLTTAIQDALVSGVIDAVIVQPLNVVFTTLFTPLTTILSTMATQFLSSIGMGVTQGVTQEVTGQVVDKAADVAVGGATDAAVMTAALAPMIVALGANIVALGANTVALGADTVALSASTVASNALTAAVIALNIAVDANTFAISADTVVPFASGGLVTKPTRALIGEAGPELIIPLNKYSLGGQVATGARGYFESGGIDKIFKLFSFESLLNLLGIPPSRFQHSPQPTVDTRPLAQITGKRPNDPQDLTQGADYSFQAPFTGMLDPLFPGGFSPLSDMFNNMGSMIKKLIDGIISNIPSMGLLGNLPQSLIRSVLNLMPNFTMPTDVNPWAVPRYASGGVVNSPTLFQDSARSLGLMGEAGAEAILPLSRGADGKLGVQSTGSRPVVVNMTISTSDAASFRRSTKQIMNEVKSAAGRM